MFEVKGKNYFGKNFPTEMSFVRKKLTKNYEKVDVLEVLYHFTAKFHLKPPALMHSNKGFPSSTKPKTPS